ncbi:MAG TPA: 2-oxo acid dehydrogenase subunit E2 [Anaerolineae bacterium]|nr:2-oxo acid dehydrogenase subunit E2 [Anaerolineae bacterium]
MNVEVIMPKLGLTMEEGTVIRWLKKAGEKVQEGEVLVEIETDKVVQEVEAPATGVLTKIHAVNGAVVPVAQVIGIISMEAKSGTDPQSTSLFAKGTLVTRKRKTVTNEVGKSQGAFKSKKRRGKLAQRTDMKISRRAKRIAEQHCIDIAEISLGSGQDGRIIEKDILNYLESREEEGGFVWKKLTHTQVRTAKRVTESFANIPHFYIQKEVIAEKLLILKGKMNVELNRSQGLHITVSDLIIKLTAAALANHLLANASWVNGRIKIYQEINVGLAVAIDNGIVVPVIRRASKKHLPEIVKERVVLVEKAHQGLLKPDMISGGTFTITNLGMFDIDSFSAIINPPQSAILAVGAVKDRPVGINQVVILKPTMKLTLSCDHRVLGGVEGAAFLQTMTNYIENPSQIIK